MQQQWPLSPAASVFLVRSTMQQRSLQPDDKTELNNHPAKPLLPLVTRRFLGRERRQASFFPYPALGGWRELEPSTVFPEADQSVFPPWHRNAAKMAPRMLRAPLADLKRQGWGVAACVAPKCGRSLALLEIRAATVIAYYLENPVFLRGFYATAAEAAADASGLHALTALAMLLRTLFDAIICSTIGRCYIADANRWANANTAHPLLPLASLRALSKLFVDPLTVLAPAMMSDGGKVTAAMRSPLAPALAACVEIAAFAGLPLIRTDKVAVHLDQASSMYQRLLFGDTASGRARGWLGMGIASSSMQQVRGVFQVWKAASIRDAFYEPSLPETMAAMWIDAVPTFVISAVWAARLASLLATVRLRSSAQLPVPPDFTASNAGFVEQRNQFNTLCRAHPLTQVLRSAFDVWDAMHVTLLQHENRRAAILVREWAVTDSAMLPLLAAQRTYPLVSFTSVETHMAAAAAEMTFEHQVVMLGVPMNDRQEIESFVEGVSRAMECSAQSDVVMVYTGSNVAASAAAAALADYIAGNRTSIGIKTSSEASSKVVTGFEQGVQAALDDGASGVVVSYKQGRGGSGNSSVELALLDGQLSAIDNAARSASDSDAVALHAWRDALLQRRLELQKQSGSGGAGGGGGGGGDGGVGWAGSRVMCPNVVKVAPYGSSASFSCPTDEITLSNGSKLSFYPAASASSTGSATASVGYKLKRPDGSTNSGAIYLKVTSPLDVRIGASWKNCGPPVRDAAGHLTIAAPPVTSDNSYFGSVQTETSIDPATGQVCTSTSADINLIATSVAAVVVVSGVAGLAALAAPEAAAIAATYAALLGASAL